MYKIYLMCLIIVLWGCAHEVERRPVNDVWPPPPAKPKIRFVEEISSMADLGDKTEGGWLKALIAGEEGIEGRLIKPYGIAVDINDKIYVTDIGKVFVFDRKSKTLMFIGDKPEPVKLKVPIGIAVAPDNRVYVSDSSYERVFIYKSDGSFINAIGDAGELKGPSGLATDAVKGRLYIADTKKNVVMAYSLDGNFLFTIDGHDTETGKFNFPTNLAVDLSGNIYVMDTGNLCVQVFNPDGKFLRAIKGGSRSKLFVRPKGMAVDSIGYGYVVDAASQSFYIFDKNGNMVLSIGEAGTDPGQFFMPAGIAVDARDRIYVVDQMNGRIQIFRWLDRN